MAKSVKKTNRASIAAKKKRQNINLRGKREEYIQNLLEFHKLQGVLLNKLAAEV
jgi:hypothetical protein